MDERQVRQNTGSTLKNKTRNNLGLALRNGQDLLKGDNPNFNQNTEFTNEAETGTSIFDPVLCEIIYKWFCVDNGLIVDPFAGGSVRGIIASFLGYEYIGIDLREEQVLANRVNAEQVLKDKKHPIWYIDNSLNINKILHNVKADLIFSCPPYFDLEVYSENKEDLSTLDYETFSKQYTEIINKSIALLKDNRFACFVVGDVRDKQGFYRNFVDLTKSAFIDAGALFYNEMILLNTLGSLPIRVNKQFSSFRKVGKTHQNVLVFYKGNPAKIKDNFGQIENNIPE
jgi:hypothetical protein